MKEADGRPVVRHDGQTVVPGDDAARRRDDRAVGGDQIAGAFEPVEHRDSS
jgi:hypothetical protein